MKLKKVRHPNLYPHLPLFHGLGLGLGLDLGLGRQRSRPWSTKIKTLVDKDQDLGLGLDLDLGLGLGLGLGLCLPLTEKERDKKTESVPSFFLFFFRHCYLFLGKLVNKIKIPSPQISPNFLPPPSSLLYFA